jgi:chromosome segregation ATPase
MSDLEREYVVQSKAPGWLIGVSVVSLLLALGALGWSLGLQNHLTAAESQLTAATQQNTQLSEKLEDTNERLRAQGEALGQSVGLTQKQLEDKSNQLVAAQRQANAATAKLRKEQVETQEQVGAVKQDVSAVKTDVASTKTDVASTQADLAQTKSQLTRVVGDQGVMSGLIATNHDELMELKRRGERSYYEFTLQKGKQAQNVGTIKLTLKKVDQKRSKYTLNVDADDKVIEKRDKNLDEPVQFYSGKTPALYEIVVNNISKNSVTGYLSTPKNAPAPISVP